MGDFMAHQGEEQSVNDEFAKFGIHWQKPPKAHGYRTETLMTLVAMMYRTLHNQAPGFLVTRDCPHTINQIKTIPLDEKHPEDVDTRAEDHIIDEILYSVVTMRGSSARQHKVVNMPLAARSSTVMADLAPGTAYDQQHVRPYGDSPLYRGIHDPKFHRDR